MKIPKNLINLSFLLVCMGIVTLSARVTQAHKCVWYAPQADMLVGSNAITFGVTLPLKLERPLSCIFQTRYGIQERITAKSLQQIFLETQVNHPQKQRQKFYLLTRSDCQLSMDFHKIFPIHSIRLLRSPFRCLKMELLLSLSITPLDKK